jgi:hypothetical protein
LEDQSEPVAYLIAHDAAETDPARLCQPLQACRDIHAVAEDVMFLHDHVAKVDADPELDPLGGRDASIPFGHPPLHLDRTADGIHNARKLRQEAIAGVLYNPAPVLRDFRIDELCEMGFEPLVRPFLIHAHQARVARHIGG